ncbi:MAG: lamin tail domain-containing protein [Planctomycetes bacterium]|nr:lamin tail domain-containing protein [Planctomycetota bacterium]MCB9934565.1 lamin tail domain-containing protein [Planctomycetota bacterium]
MRHFALLLSLLATVLATSCSSYANTLDGDVQVPQSNGPNPQNLPNPNTVPKPTPPGGYTVSPTPVVIQEVLVDPSGPNAGNQFLELFNSSTSPVDIGGWIVTDGFSSHTFGYGFQLAAGQCVVLHLGAFGTDNNAEQFVPSFAELQATGSMALLRSGVDLVDFVEWGAANQNYEGTADQIAEWTAGDFVVPPAEGLSLNYNGTANNSTAWIMANASPGQ